MTINRQWILRERPTGMVGAEHFDLVEAEMPVADTTAGEVLLKTLYLGFDPAMHPNLCNRLSLISGSSAP